LHLELDGHGPLHAQLTRALRASLGAGVGPGGRLPSSRQLARELGISRNTVVAAYEQLLAEGAIESRAASGVFVARPAAADPPIRAPAWRREPQSRYARRARRFHDHAALPSHPIEGVRYRFDCSTPSTNPALTTAWARELARAAVYTSPFNADAQGLPQLREAICDYLVRRRGVAATPDDVLVVNGTQQAIALTARILLDEGDEVAIEEPHYFAIRQVLQVHGAQLVGVPVDGEGLICEALSATAPPRMICVTPSHQFPTGAIMSQARRRALLDYADRNDCWIFEDDYDGEFRHGAPPLATLRSQDDGRVIYAGTFSKSLFPALRLGYVVMPPGLRDDFVAAKWLHDFSSPAIEQAALARFISSGGFDRHMRRSSEELQQRRRLLITELARLGDRVDVADAPAGMHLLVWLRGMSRAQGEALRVRARVLGVGIPAVAPEYLSPPDRAGLLLKYAGISLQEIREAIPLLARCLDEVAAAGPVLPA